MNTNRIRKARRYRNGKILSYRYGQTKEFAVFKWKNEGKLTNNNICFNCFSGTGGQNPCPYCGFENYSACNYPQQLPLGTILNRQYLVGRALGQGGFGITYLGYDLSSNQRMAIKEYFPSGLAIRQGLILQPITQETQTAFLHGVELFYKEATILAKLIRYPNIVSVFNFFQENGTAYFVMEYIEGLSFKDYLESRGGRIPFEEALNLLFPVMQSLDIVHHEGMLHRDIAPDNIYITRGGQTKLLDFGAARFHQRDDTHSIRTIIKPGYAPMEQYTSTSAQGPWTDVYAIGATFYRAITGIVPPDAPTRAMHDEIRSPSQLGVQLPAEADSAIMRALAPNIVFRFRSVTDFCRNLVQSETASAQNTAKSNPPLPPTVLSEHPTQWLNPAGKQPEPVTRVILSQPPFQSDVKNLEHTGFFRKAINRLSKFISDNVSLSWILVIGVIIIVLILLTVLWIKP